MAKILPIVKEPNKSLRQRAKELPLSEISTARVQKLIANMKETLKNTPNGVGLAAPQVGESLRIFIVSEEAQEIDHQENLQKKEQLNETKNPDSRKKKNWKYYVFINPAVKKIARKKLAGPEGCLSVTDKYGLVKRNEKITVQAYDEHGKKFIRGASNFFARVIQHELDHLEGTLFIDKVDEYLDQSKT